MIKLSKKINLYNYIKLRIIKPDPQVVLFISGNGTLGSTTLIDNSMYARTITTEFGTYTYNSNQVKSYSTSVVGGGVGAWSTTLPVPGVNQSWCWEMWIYLTENQLASSGAGFGFLSLDQNSNYIIMSRGPGNSGTNQIGLSQGAIGQWYALSTSSLAANQWTHIAMSSEDLGNGSATLRSFVNGTLEGTYTGAPFSLPMGGKIYSGLTANSGFSNPNYYFENYRITQGSARYTSNFTPPTDF